MYECYTLELEGSALRFAPRKDGGKDLAYLPGQPPKGYTLINLIGDPALLHCAIFRKEEGPGGFFCHARHRGSSVYGRGGYQPDLRHGPCAHGPHGDVRPLWRGHI